jgi:hypothetical protein
MNTPIKGQTFSQKASKFDEKMKEGFKPTHG